MLTLHVVCEIGQSSVHLHFCEGSSIHCNFEMSHLFPLPQHSPIPLIAQVFGFGQQTFH